MFILCGILYGVDSATAANTQIRFGLDLYTQKLLDIDIPFSNPFNDTSTIGYNHNTKELYTWTVGNQLTYLVQINALGANVTKPESIHKVLEKTIAFSTLKLKSIAGGAAAITVTTEKNEKKDMR